jgi:uncharacterized protein
MGNRQTIETSPLRTAALHTGLSFAAFALAGGGLASLVHLTGDPTDASPRVSIALFDPEPPVENVRLKSRFVEQDSVPVLASVLPETPDLAVKRPMGPPTKAMLVPGEGTAKVLTVADAVAAPANGQPTASIVRINGQAVPQGMSLNRVELAAKTSPDQEAPEAEVVTPLPPAPIAGLREKVNGQWLPRIAEDGRSPAEAYARPSNADPSAPRIALVVGGLGINHNTTLQAIRELPADITLSFAPRKSSWNYPTQYYIDRARADGHEVLIEVPMEPYEYGRKNPEPNTLRPDAPVKENISALNATLSKASGYIGIVNYQGAKYAAELEAVRPVVDALAARGLVIVEDGSLPRSAMADAARGRDVAFREAASVIDADVSAASITEELAGLEAEALVNGSALGTGFAFPVTIDTIVEWREGLSAKGITLVPASAVIGEAERTGTRAADTGPETVPAPAMPPDGGKAG